MKAVSSFLKSKIYFNKYIQCTVIKNANSYITYQLKIHLIYRVFHVPSSVLASYIFNT